MATLKDVAALADVSIAAVSYYINNTRNLSPQTRTKIQNAIKELNYIPNAQARNLRVQTSKEIYAIFPDLEDPCYNEYLKGMIFQAEDAGYSLRISCSYNDILKEQQLIEDAISKNSIGILLITCQPQNSSFFKEKLKGHQMAAVFIDRLPYKMDVIYFGFDNYATIQFLTQELLKKGYRDIALMTGPDSYFSESECIAGYNDIMDSFQAEEPGSRQLTSDGTKEGAFQVFLKNWGQNPPQAVLASSQLLCQGIIEACSLLSLRIPEDICVITLDVDNWNRSSFYPNVIRTTRPAFALGVQSARALIDSVEHSETPENRFHQLKDTIKNYPLGNLNPPKIHLTRPVRTTKSIRIAGADLPTLHALKDIGMDFQNKYNIRLELDIFEYRDLLNTILSDSAREIPSYDIYLYDTSWFYYLARQDCLKDLTKEFSHIPEINRYISSRYLQNCSMDEKIYGFPIVGGTQFLLYRRDLFSDPVLQAKYKSDHKISLRPPITWKEFNSIARFFTKEYNPDSPTSYGTALAQELNEEFMLEFEPRMWSYGGNFFDHHGHLCINSPQNIRAASNFLETLQYARPNTPSNQDVFSAFARGEVAMIVTFTEYAAQVQSSSHSEYLHKINYCRLPGQTPANVGWHLGIPRHSEKVEDCILLFKWLLHRHTSYYMSILGAASSMAFPYRNHELQKMYPWLNITSESLESCRSRIYPCVKRKGFLAPNEFEAIICDALRKRPQSPREIENVFTKAQSRALHLLS